MTDKPSASNLVSRRKMLAATGGAGVIALAGCSEASEGGDDGSGGDDGGSGGDGMDDGGSGGDGGDQTLSGNIRISGSSTVYPVATAVSELFKEENPEVVFDISRDGSSGGFDQVFIPGDSDLNNSSRSIKDSEVQRCEDNGIEPVEFMVARDALTVVVNNDNDFIDTLTYADLEAIWSPENPAQNWSDINSEWPDEEIDLFGPASTSGTYDFFTETVLGEAGRIRSDFEGTEEDDQIAQGVQGSEYALGYLPFAYYTNNPDDTQAVPLAEEEGQEPVAPSLEAASSGEYALARPLFFYANNNKLSEKEHLQAFVEFYINKSTDETLISQQVGYVPASEDLAEDNLSKLDEYR